MRVIIKLVYAYEKDPLEYVPSILWTVCSFAAMSEIIAQKIMPADVSLFQ